MDERTQALVLRVHPLTETSLIVRWLTREMGRVATVAKGALRPKSPFRGKLDLFYFADITIRWSRHSELHALREVTLHDSHPFLRRELGYLQQASYCAALIEQVTEIETPILAVFDLLKTFLEMLGNQPPASRNVIAFELKLLNELGLKPDLEKTRLTGGAKEIIKNLTATEWSSINQLHLSQPQETELRQFLHGFLIFHLGKAPKSRGAALKSALNY